jgi:hypothetical protein
MQFCESKTQTIQLFQHLNETVISTLASILIQQVIYQTPKPLLIVWAFIVIYANDISPFSDGTLNIFCDTLGENINIGNNGELTISENVNMKNITRTNDLFSLDNLNSTLNLSTLTNFNNVDVNFYSTNKNNNVYNYAKLKCYDAVDISGNTSITGCLRLLLL